MKRGQITAFIILGILLLFLVSLFLLVQNRSAREDLGVEVEKTRPGNAKQMMQIFVDSCLKKTTLDAIRIVSRTGGYYKIPFREPFLEDALYPYYIVEGTPYPVTRDFVTEEIKSYIELNLVQCTNAPETLEEFGFEIEADPYDADVFLADDFVHVDLTYPLTIIQGTRRDNLADFSYHSEKIPLGLLINASHDYLREQEPFLFGFCYTCLFQALDAYDIDASVEVIPITNITWIIKIEDNEAIVNGKPFLFEFAIKLLDPCGPLPDGVVYGGICEDDFLEGFT